MDDTKTILNDTNNPCEKSIPPDWSFFDEPQTIWFNNMHHLDLGAAAAWNFFGRCFDWFKFANNTRKKIRIVIDFDPNTGKSVATFAQND